MCNFGVEIMQIAHLEDIDGDGTVLDKVKSVLRVGSVMDWFGIVSSGTMVGFVVSGVEPSCSATHCVSCLVHSEP